MSNVLKCDCHTGDSYVSESISLPSSWWLEFGVAVPASCLSAIASFTESANLGSLYNGSGPSPTESFFLGDGSTSTSLSPPPAAIWTALAPGGAVASAFSSDTWHTVKAHFNGTTIVWTLDGTTEFSYTQSYAAGTWSAIFGGLNATASTGEVYYIRDVKIGTTDGATDIFGDDFSSGDTSAWDSTVGASTVVDDPFSGGSQPEGVSIAFTNDPLDDPVTWTRIDNVDDVHIGNIQIRRGRQTERDKTETGTVTITGYDTGGVLDPTNPDSPFAGNLAPVKQIAVTLFNPDTSEWNYLFRGHVASIKHTLDPTEKFTSFEIDCVDMLDLLNDAEIQGGEAGIAPTDPTFPQGSLGDTYWAGDTVQNRLLAVLADASTAFFGQVWPSSLYVIASGNVDVKDSVYSRGTSLLQIVDEACDAELPGATNRFATFDGKFGFRGRYYRFVPDFYIPSDNTTRTSGTEMLHWNVGDKSAFGSDNTIAVPTDVQFTVDKTDLINICQITPKGISNADLSSGANLSSDSTSITNYGPRTSGMSLENLITGAAVDGNTDLQETSSFASAIVSNYKDPVTYVNQLMFRNPLPDGTDNYTNTWKLLSGIELSDLVTYTDTHPGGGGFNADTGVEQDHYIESITYDLAPLQGDVWDVTLTVGLSSRHHFRSIPDSWDPPD